MSGVRPIKAYAVIKNNKLDANEIYRENDLVLTNGEKIVRVIISVDETKSTKKKK